MFEVKELIFNFDLSWSYVFGKYKVICLDLHSIKWPQSFTMFSFFLCFSGQLGLTDSQRIILLCPHVTRKKSAEVGLFVK